MSAKISKYLKKVIAAALILSFSAGLIPFQPISDAFVASISVKAAYVERNLVDSEFDEGTGTLTLKEGTYNNPQLVKWDSTTYSYNVDRSKVTSIKTSGKVVFTGDCEGLFQSFYNLESINLSDVDTSGVTTMESMFSGCSKLEAVDLSDLDTSGVTTMESMFSGCNKLEAVDMTGLDTSSVTDMSDLFQSCTSLTKADLKGINVGSVTNMAYMFDGCSSLAQLDLTGLNTGSVTNMISMFSRCTSLSQIDMTGMDTSNVKSMCYMFNGCSSLTSIPVIGLDTASVTDITGMFDGCTALTKVDLAGFDTSNVYDMSRVFEDCTSLTEVDFSGLDTGKVTDMTYMFQGCTSLEKVNMTGINADSVNSTYYMFDGCKSLKKLDLSAFGFIESGSSYNMFIGASIEELTISDSMKIFPEMRLINFGAWIDDNIKGDGTVNESTLVNGWKKQGNEGIVSDLSDDAEFSGAGTYKINKETIKWSYDHDKGKVTLISGIYSRGVICDIYSATEKYCEDNGCEMVYTDEYGSIDTFEVYDGVAFAGDCSAIFDVGSYHHSNYVLFDGKIDTSKVINMSNMFCMKMDGLDLSSLDTSNVVNMDGMFSGFETNDNNFVLDLNGLDTSKVTSMYGMFSNCRVSVINIKKLKMPEDTVLSFNGCENLRSLTLPENWKPKTLENFLSSCYSLESVDFSGVDLSEVESIDRMCSYCHSLKSIVMPEIHLTSYTSSGVFENCENLETADLSKLVFSDNCDISNMFYNCSALKTVILPENAEEIGMSYIFSGCSSLESVNFQNLKYKNISGMNSAFNGCKSLKEIDLSGCKSESGYCYFYDAFKGCTSLETVKLPSFKVSMDDSNSYKFRDMFSGAENLASITFSSDDNQTSTLKISDNLKLENSNYVYTGWRTETGDKYISGSGEYAAFNAAKGITYVRDKVKYDKLIIKNASLTLEGQIGVNFYMDVPTDLGEDAYVLMSGSKGDQKIMLKDCVPDKNNGYRFTYKVSAKEIHDKVTLKVFKDSSTEVSLYKTGTDGEPVEISGNKFTYSVYDYIKSVQNGEYDEKLVNLVNALEAYGSYSQKYFGYNVSTANVDSLKIKDEVAAVSADDLSGYKFYSENIPDDVKFLGYSLILSSETSVKLYFESENMDKYFKSEDLDEGVELVNQDGNKFCLIISDIPANSLGNTKYLYIKTSSEEKTDDYGNTWTENKFMEFNVSPLSYAYSALSMYGDNAEKTDLCNAMKVLYLYYNAARNYF